MTAIGAHGLGTFDKIKRGPREYFRYRVTIRGKTYECTGRTREALMDKVTALRLGVRQAGDMASPPLSTDAKGRQWVAIDAPAFREWIYHRDRGLCGLCGHPVAFDDVHVDHIRPVGEGGNHHVDNLRVSHPACNLKRSLVRRRMVRFA